MSADGKRRSWVSALAVFALIAACAPHDPRAEWEQSAKATARVTMIDRETRRMDIRVGFRNMSVRVAEGVEGFDSRRVGDVIDLIYYEAMLVALAPEAKGETKVLTKYRLAPATPERPAIAYVRARKFTAEFQDFDYQSNIATFKLPDGSYPILIVPQRLRPFVRTLLPGDRIAVSVEEAIAVSMAPRD